ncbi:ATP-binding protein [Haloarchaeobius sp. HME9146]|uniref:sensor histidine kinase n=1 Tax=Haloarchaeobius sp. HME9146 TaxID=2978732 RepID=UPI0021C0BCA5|nr:ATP-binding protein [Haloarchaeobius sp. HME9146]MCT9096381.1 ATP-binding protein [Haloarchaeobius sp. HME9146]
MSTGAKKVRDYELLHEVAQAVANADSFEAALSETIELVCRSTEWVYGEVWTVAPNGTELVPSDSWYGSGEALETFRRVTEKTSFPRKVGLPGRVWDTGEVEWLHDVSAGPPSYFVRSAPAKAAGLRTAVGVPIIDMNEVIAVLAFFMGEPKPTDERWVSLVSTIGILGGLYARKEHVVELEAEREDLEERIEASPIGVLVYDASGQIVDVNPQGADILGSDVDDLLSERHDEQTFEFFDIDGERIPTEDLPVARVFESGSPVRGVQLGVSTPKGERWVLLNAAPVSDDSGTVQEVVVVVEDMTSRYSWEQEIARQNERLSQFANAVSHDLRTPLSTAGAALALAREDPSKENFDRVESALLRMETIIDDVLQLAREGRKVIATDSVSLASVAGQAWESISPPDATLEVVGDMTIQADQERLQRLLENMFRNSIEHGGPTVTVRTGRMDGGFFVEDDGPGIPTNEREQVFEMGYTTGDSGTGFGLAIVREIVNAHDWEIRGTDSTIGGIRFEVRVR